MKNVKLRALGPCQDGLEYAESHRSFQAAWDACDRGDWMLWVLGRVAGPVGSVSRKKLVLVACACARLALKHVPKGERRPLAAIEAAEDYAHGGETTLEQVQSATTDATAAAAYAANAAAYAAAYAATTAAAYAARKKALADCADIVREHYPKAPTLGRK